MLRIVKCSGYYTVELFDSAGRLRQGHIGTLTFEDAIKMARNMMAFAGIDAAGRDDLILDLAARAAIVRAALN